MVEFSSSWWENEIHKIDSPSYEDSKDLTFSARLNFGGVTVRKLRENGQ